MSSMLNPWRYKPPFIFEVTVGASEVVTLPLISGGQYDFYVDWGDGNQGDNVLAWNSALRVHTYIGAGTYAIRILGTCSIFRVANVSPIKTQITDILQFGDTKLAGWGLNFYGCTNLIYVSAKDVPNLKNVSVLEGLFNGCTNLTSVNNLNSWNTSSAVNMKNLFSNCLNFNQDLDNWNTSNATDFTGIFSGCIVFNGLLTNWNTSKVIIFSSMFSGAQVFNQPLNHFNVSSGSSFISMFQNAWKFNQPLDNWVFKTTGTINFDTMFNVAREFNQPINSWNVERVTNMTSTFGGCWAFDQDLDTWDTSNVTLMPNTFSSCLVFNGNVSTWNTANVTNMSGMFNVASLFNQNLNTSGSVWDVSKVTNMSLMFRLAGTFNGTLTGWNTTACTNMDSMFESASDFNQPLSHFDVDAVTTFHEMFLNASVFNQNIGNWVIKPTGTVLMSSMFNNSGFNNGGSNTINNWNVSRVTVMNSMFAFCPNFNQPLGNWDLSSCTTLFATFNGATIFNQNLNTWKVNTVTNFGRMFEAANAYNQSISTWNTVSATAMQEMFEGNTAFNQKIGHLDLRGVVDLTRFATSHALLDQNIGGLDITTTVASSLINLTAHGYATGDVVHFVNFTNTTGITEEDTYYVSETSNTANSFRITTDPTGAAAGDVTFGGGDDASGVRMNGWVTGTVHTWAWGFSQADSWKNIEYLDMSGATVSLATMFDGRTNMAGVDISGWNLPTSGTITLLNFNRNGNLDCNFSLWNATPFSNCQEAFEGVRTASGNYDLMLEQWSLDSVKTGVILGMHPTLCNYTQGTGESGTTTATTTNKLVDSGATFLTSGVLVNDIIRNTTDNTYAKVTAIDSDTTLSLDANIMVSGEGYRVQTSAAAKGRYRLLKDYSWIIVDSGPI